MVGVCSLSTIGYTKYNTKPVKATVANFNITNKENNTVQLYSNSTDIHGLKLNLSKFDIDTNNITSLSEDLKINFYAKIEDNAYSQINEQINISLESHNESINLLNYIDYIDIVNTELNGKLPEPDGPVKNMNIKIEINHADLTNVNTFEYNFDVKVDIDNVIAKGGNIYNKKINNVDYKIHEFNTIGEHTFEVTSEGEIDILIVGGGGGGGNTSQFNSTGGGGGGAGGLIFENNLYVNEGTHNIQIGDGGNGKSTHDSGDSGGDSIFDDYLVAFGGGGGASSDSDTLNVNSGCLNNSPCKGMDGGSGGGGGHRAEPGESINNQGHSGGKFNGEYGSDGDYYGPTSGGGGAGEPGGSADVGYNNGTKGGDGLYYGDTFSNDFGENGWFSGGGGGVNSGYDGGKGGGGRAATDVGNSGQDGLQNTGGGGGSGSATSSGKSGQGGSGIILIRYKQI